MQGYSRIGPMCCSLHKNDCNEYPRNIHAFTNLVTQPPDVLCED